MPGSKKKLEWSVIELSCHLREPSKSDEKHDFRLKLDGNFFYRFLIIPVQRYILLKIGEKNS